MYLDTPMEDPEYAWINVKDIPQEFIDKYGLDSMEDNDGLIYFEIRQGCYGLPQEGKLSNNSLQECLKAAGHYKATTTPGL